VFCHQQPPKGIKKKPKAKHNEQTGPFVSLQTWFGWSTVFKKAATTKKNLEKNI
jgi:hypothetical protein